MPDHRYGIILCPKCSSPRVADLSVKSTKCSSCGRSIILKKMRLYAQADTPQQLIPKMGEINKGRHTSLHEVFELVDENLSHTTEFEIDQDGRDVNEPEKQSEEGPFGDTDNDVFKTGCDEITDEHELDPPHVPPRKLSAGNRMDRLRSALLTMGEFTVGDMEGIVTSLGWKREKGVELLKGMMSHGEVYSPRKGWFRMIP